MSVWSPLVTFQSRGVGVSRSPRWQVHLHVSFSLSRGFIEVYVAKRVMKNRCHLVCDEGLRENLMFKPAGQSQTHPNSVHRISCCVLPKTTRSWTLRRTGVTFAKEWIGIVLHAALIMFDQGFPDEIVVSAKWIPSIVESRADAISYWGWLGLRALRSCTTAGMPRHQLSKHSRVRWRCWSLWSWMTCLASKYHRIGRWWAKLSHARDYNMV